MTIDSDRDVVEWLMQEWRPTHAEMAGELFDHGWDGNGQLCCTATRIFLIEKALQIDLGFPGYATLNSFQRTVALLDLVRNGLEAVIGNEAQAAIDKILAEPGEDDHA